MPRLFRPSGGMLYHLRALRTGRLWAPFRSQLATWLAEWTIPRDHALILIGASGGYTLSADWLAHFPRIHVYDLDPLAPLFFKLRFFRNRKIRHATSFQSVDMFWRGGRLSLDPVKESLARHPNASWLFCNILGQIPLEGAIKPEEWQTYLCALRDLLRGQRWASYHDVYTLEPLAREHHAHVFDKYRRTSDITKSLHLPLEVVDHDLKGIWSEGFTPRTFAWSLTGKSLHVIEGVQS